jgi:hypothetical protein
MTLWSDPVIARAHVKAEVVHYSKLIFVIFSHLSKETIGRFQLVIVEQVRTTELWVLRHFVELAFLSTTLKYNLLY